jgi:hypothetical protein
MAFYFVSTFAIAQTPTKQPVVSSCHISAVGLLCKTMFILAKAAVAFAENPGNVALAK